MRNEAIGVVQPVDEMVATRHTHFVLENIARVASVKHCPSFLLFDRRNNDLQDDCDRALAQSEQSTLQSSEPLTIREPDGFHLPVKVTTKFATNNRTLQCSHIQRGH